jgi:hypothetical protein
MRIPFYLDFDVTVNCFYGTSESEGFAQSGINRNYNMALLINPDELTILENDSDETILIKQSEKEMYDKMFANGVYVHGRAGIFDEIDYTDNDLDNQILPTK